MVFCCLVGRVLDFGAEGLGFDQWPDHGDVPLDKVPYTYVSLFIQGYKWKPTIVEVNLPTNWHSVQTSSNSFFMPKKLEINTGNIGH